MHYKVLTGVGSRLTMYSVLGNGEKILDSMLSAVQLQSFKLEHVT